MHSENSAASHTNNEQERKLDELEALREGWNEVVNAIKTGTLREDSRYGKLQ